MALSSLKSPPQAPPPPARQDLSGAERALEPLSHVLLAGEELEAFALEHPTYAFMHRRGLAAATSGRLLYFYRPLIGGFSLFEARWQDVEGVHFVVGMFSATLTVRVAPRTDLALPGQQLPPGSLVLPHLVIPNAITLYRICQRRAQEWREKRRVRELEELRASSGGWLGGRGASELRRTPTDALQGRLEELHQLWARGLITDAELEALRAKILAG